MAKSVANTLVWHARQGWLTGIWTPNKIVKIMNMRREVPTNYSNALKANIKAKINARPNNNRAQKIRALQALNVLFERKPALRPTPITEYLTNNISSPPNSRNKNNRQANAPTPTYREHLNQYGNY